MGNPRDNFVIIPLSTYQKMYGTRGSLSLKVQAVSPEAIPAAQDEVRVALRTRRHLKYQDEDTFGIVSAEALNNMRDRIFGTISIVAVGVTSIALVVGGIVIMNMMLVSVTERTKEIGVRKAIGARRRDIIGQFLVEAMTLTGAGGVIGIVFAVMVTMLVGALVPSLPSQVPSWALGAGFSVSVSVGLFFGVWPAVKAARLDPVEALRYE
jgi:putative ABC transport system permease protein